MNRAIGKNPNLAPDQRIHFHRQAVHVARVLCGHRLRSMAGEGLVGFDPELVADASSDVVAERNTKITVSLFVTDNR